VKAYNTITLGQLMRAWGAVTTKRIRKEEEEEEETF
jgi:hypothetical protein